MGWELFHDILTGLAVLGTILFLSATLVAVWRVRGIFGWNRSLRHEFRRLEQQTKGTPEIRKEAVAVVLERCREVWHSHLAELPVLDHLYLRDREAPGGAPASPDQVGDPQQPERS
jgi:hypothetical protein